MKRRFSRNAFSLVEVTIALGIAAFSLIAVFGLLPTGVTSNKATIEQTAAVNLLSAICADLRATPATSAASSQFAIAIPAAGETPTPVGGPVVKFFNERGMTVATSASARCLLNIWITPPAAGSKQATTARLLLTWPAQATIANALGSVETVVALDRN
jgi:uncharacterized protein (TIGR02598 family)